MIGAVRRRLLPVTTTALAAPLATGSMTEDALRLLPITTTAPAAPLATGSMTGDALRLLPRLAATREICADDGLRDCALRGPFPFLDHALPLNGSTKNQAIKNPGSAIQDLKPDPLGISNIHSLTSH